MTKKKYNKKANDKYREKLKAEGFVFKGIWIDKDSLNALNKFNETAKQLNAGNKKIALKLGLLKAVKLLQADS